MKEFELNPWLQWMKEVYYKPQPVPGYPNFKVDRTGAVYKNDVPIKPFNSNASITFRSFAPPKNMKNKDSK